MEITKLLLAANSDYSSMWNYRKNAFLHLKTLKNEDEMKSMFDNELQFIESCLRNNPKSYGCWHHRCFVMLHMMKPNWERELQLCDLFLQFDERNFHCWDYRRFVTNHSNVPHEKEIEVTNKIIASNFSNYSSWHYRSKLLPQVYPDPTDSKRIEEKKLLEELELVQNAFFTDPNDQSAWFYHRWLLGRGDKEQYIVSLIVNRSPPSVFCCLRKPVKMFNGTLSVDDTTQTVDWTSSMSERYSHLWFCKLEDGFKKGQQHTVSCEVESSKLSCCLEENCQKATVCLPINREMFQDHTSQAKLSVLEDELNSCNELNDLEPGNKWVMLTLVLLMRAVSPKQHSEKISTMLDALTEIDSQRKRYYLDLRSKYAIEDCIVETNLNENRLNISGMKLTQICHLELVPTLTHLNISHNCLQNLTVPFANLFCLEVLEANDNKITNISGLKDVPNLKSINLDSNDISDVKQFEYLKTCRCLEKLSIRSNPVCESEKQFPTTFLLHFQ
uniref:Geranylgeranyl transferase type-2 subunit alpha n=1 Tax=Phallusia mammillata TaxID=59560 RepID=A0A6F9DQC9_9ASCI|nr:geranylgeranyl transferase type-2 subunit alpha [Phallusia mammillata]